MSSSKQLPSLRDDLQETFHDLSQPLLGCLHYARRLLQTNLTPKQKEEVANLEKSLYRAFSLVRELRDRTTPSSSKQSCCINAAIETAVKAYVAYLDEREIEVALELSVDLPLVSGNSTQLERVIANLVFNAIEAMESQGRKRLLMLNTDSEGTSGLVRITIADTGPGIPIENLLRIFEPFFTTKPQGKGLGLTICKAIVLDHNGWIEARNHPEGGAVFVVSLPIATRPLRR